MAARFFVRERGGVCDPNSVSRRSDPLLVSVSRGRQLELMMIRFRPLFTIIAVLGLVPAAAQAQSIGLTAGTPGVGLELGFQTGEVFGVRLTSGWLSIGKGV